MKLFFLIPFFNEAENFPKLAEDLGQFIQKASCPCEIFFVNDGSTDESTKAIQAAFQGMPYKILSHDFNKGPGAAFQTGLQEILSIAQDTDYILTLEADNTSNLAIVPQMQTRMQEGYDVVLASPYLYGGTIINTPWHRRTLSFIANLFLKEMLELRGLLTISSFFRLYKVKTLRAINTLYQGNLIENQGFEGVVELLMKLVFQKTPISEVPLVLDTSRRKGKSKMKILKTTYSISSLFFQKRRWK